LIEFLGGYVHLWLVPTVVATACVGLACIGEPRDTSEDASAESPATATPPTPQQAVFTQDTTAIGGYLRQYDYNFVEVLAKKGSYYAVLAADTIRDELYLLPLRTRQDSVTAVDDAWELGWAGRPFLTKWVSLGRRDVDALVVS
jgi:hypothetical protein